MGEPTYTVASGYDSRIIARGLSRQQRDDLMDRICRHLSSDDMPPRWEVDRG